MKNKAFYVWILLGVVFVAASRLSAADLDGGVKKAVETIAAWQNAHPSCLMIIHGTGRYRGQPYEITWRISKYLDKDEKANWRLLNTVIRPNKFEVCAYPEPDGKTLLYFTGSKLLTEFDPRQNFMLQINDWILRKEIDLEDLGPLLSNAEVIASQPTLSELRFTFDPEKLRSKFHLPGNMPLGLSIFFAPDGQIQKCSRTFMNETVNATVEYPSFDNNYVIEHLPEIAPPQLKPSQMSYLMASERDARSHSSQRPAWVRMVILSLLIGPLAVAIGFYFFKRKSPPAS